MENDRAFAVYSLTLIASTVCMATWAMAATGLQLTAYSTALVLQELAFGITFRAAYKSFDGSNWILDLLHATGMVTPSDGIGAEDSIALIGAEAVAA
jgi:hypothetical protein